LEEEIFYPAVKALDTEEPVEEVLEAREEHQIVKTLLAPFAAGAGPFRPRLRLTTFPADGGRRYVRALTGAGSRTASG
jgi:hypothetical protein